MDGLKEFIKYNPMLFHIDLQTTGLPAQIIRDIGHVLTRATSLQSIHLCGNEGINDQMIEWLRKRIRAKEPVQALTIVPHEKNTLKQNDLESSPPREK